MRGTTLSRLQESHANDHIMATPPAAGRSNAIPSIRLVAATPSNAGSSFESNVSSPTFHVPQASNLPSLPETILPSPLAPSPANRKRVVPKKSKLSMLGKAVRTREAKERDLSDVVRRVGASSASARGGFDIFVDPTEDPEIGEIVMVKKKKSRVALDSIFGESSSKSTAPMKDATNNAALPQKKQSTGPMSLLKRSTGAASVLKSEDENSQKWWSMSRGRKDSKPKAKGELLFILTTDSLLTLDAAETPKSDSRNRFNSLDSGVLLNSPIACDLPAELQAITERQTNGAAKLSFASSPKPSSMGRSISFSPMTALEAAPPMIKAHSMIPTGDNTGCIATPPPILRASSMIPSGNNTGLLVPPPAVPPGAKDASNTGSIAVRAMRSMRSLATISSWAQLKDGSVRGSKEKEEKPAKEAKPKKEKASKKGKADTVRAVSGSSFEVGALSPPETSPVQANSERTKNLGDRKRSVLGLGMGWPSTLRSASSPVVAAAVPAPVVHVSAPVETETVASRPPPSAFSTVRMSSDAKRLSSDSHLSSSSAEGILASTVGRARAGSRSTMSSTNSSLRPLSSASGHSAGSCGSSAISVRWDEEGLATVKEARKRERATRRGPMESRRGSEERKRNSLASVFPETREQIRTASGGYKPAPEEDEEEDRPAPPIVNIETATTADGHSIREDIADSEYENDEGSMPSRTPQRLPRPRPLSEQLLGQMRPRAMTDDSEGWSPASHSDVPRSFFYQVFCRSWMPRRTSSPASSAGSISRRPPRRRISRRSAPTRSRLS
jgi:serine/arginine repetitive matrix protein 2